MKNIFEIMKEYGLEVPDDKKKDFEKVVLENYKTVTDYENQVGKLEKANETIKANDTAIKELNKKLEDFKDVDVSELKQSIENLKTENGNIEEKYKKQLEERDFNDDLKDAVKNAHGRNYKAIVALLDEEKMEKLKASKNRKEDVAAALKELSEAEDSKFLFGEDEPEVLGTGDPIGTVRKQQNVTEDTDKMRSIMGLPPVAKGE